MSRQYTLRNTVRAAGTGLHSGHKVYMALRPAPANSGIVFRRTDLPAGPREVRASAPNVGDTRLCTSLVDGEVRVATVEHLLSAMSGLGIDNAVVELSAAEVPIMDGSAAPFVFLLQSAGLEQQDAPRRFLRVLERVVVEDEGKWARFDPWDGFRVDFTIDFDHPLFRNHSRRAVVDFATTSYVREVSRARTFGFMREIDTLRAGNLALGGSLDNAVVVDDHRVLNEDGLRFEDEFVKHKILDAIGDIYLAGHRVIGQFTGYCSGHDLNNRLVRALLDRPAAWEIVEFNGAADTPVCYSEAQPA